MKKPTVNNKITHCSKSIRVSSYDHINGLEINLRDPLKTEFPKFNSLSNFDLILIKISSLSSYKNNYFLKKMHVNT